MKYPCILTMFLLIAGRMMAQEVTAQVRTQPVFQILSESTVQQQDGSTTTFRQVVPPVVAAQAQPAAAPAVAPAVAPTQSAALSQMPVKESKLLSISASVKANGFTVLRWTCGTSERLQAVSNVDFRYLEGLASLQTERADYLLVLSAGPDDQAMTEAEARAAHSLPANGSASFALIRGHSLASQADEAALDAMDSLLDYFASNRDALVHGRAKREADRAMRELAARKAPPPRHTIIHFWPLQPAQRAAIQAQARREAKIKARAQSGAQGVNQGGQQP